MPNDGRLKLSINICCGRVYRVNSDSRKEITYSRLIDDGVFRPLRHEDQFAPHDDARHDPGAAQLIQPFHDDGMALEEAAAMVRIQDIAIQNLAFPRRA